MKKLPLIRFQLSGLRWSLLLALLGLIIAFNLIASNHVLFKELVNSSHCFVFFLATLLLLQQSTTRDEPNSLFYQCAIVGLISLFIGIMIELIQPYFGRSRSMLDMTYNVLGIGAAICVHTQKFLTIHTKKHLISLLAVGLLFCSLILPSGMAYSLIQKQRSYPVLFNFEQGLEPLFWRAIGHASITVSEPPATWKNESKSLKLTVDKSWFSGINFTNFPGNWLEREQLKLAIYAEEPSKMTLKIYDQGHNHDYHDRFNRKLSLSKGLNLISVDLEDIKHASKDRVIDMTAITSMSLFVVQAETAQTFYIDDIYLD